VRLAIKRGVRRTAEDPSRGVRDARDHAISLEALDDIGGGIALGFPGSLDVDGDAISLP
jgi:hypothetical protein